MTRETLIEMMARAMFEDGWSLDPRHPDKEEVWLSEASDWLSNATAALLALEAAGVRMVDDETMLDWRIEVESATESLMGIAGAIQDGKLEGRQDQCYRTRDRLLRLLHQMRASPFSPPAKDTEREGGE